MFDTLISGHQYLIIQRLGTYDKPPCKRVVV